MGADREEGNIVSDHNKQLQKDRKGDFILTRFKTEKWQTEGEVRGCRGPRWICDTVFTAKFHLFVLNQSSAESLMLNSTERMTVPINATF